MDIAEKLGKENISVEVLDPRSLFQLDKDAILESVKKTSRAVVVHESPVRGGAGAEIAAIISDEGFEYLDAPIKRVGVKDSPILFP